MTINLLSIVKNDGFDVFPKFTRLRQWFSEGDNMANSYTAVTKQDGDWWIGWIEEVPGVNCQEPTHAKLLASLRETLREALEFNRQDAISAAVANYTEELVTV